MALSPGTRLGPHEILVAIGEGGMGQVYRARDTRLGRDVAIKVLPPAFASDPDRRARFDREAQAIAALSHPHIVSVFDAGVHDDQAYVVMELLEGETLRDRLAGGALPLRKAIEYGVQIARGLAAAHDKNLVHRDLKPDNIFLTTAGHVKILDFGLARPTQHAAGTGATETVPALTDPGQVMGTMGYMAPEQVRGFQVDGRADLFAFGVVLYEMVTGRRAFQRDTPADTMTAILKEDPPEPLSTGVTLSPALERIIRHCLKKHPAERFQSARDVAFALESLSGSDTSAPSGAVSAAVGASSSRARLSAREGFAWVIGVAGIAAAAFLLWRTPAAPRQPVTRFRVPVDASSTSLAASVALAPDGHAMVAQTAWASKDTRLHLRRLDSNAMDPLQGTEGALGPFWSPDSASVGFITNGQLKRYDFATSTVRPIASVGDLVVTTLAWGPHDTIVIANLSGSLHIVKTDSGKVSPLGQLDSGAGEVTQRRPVFLPDGRLLYRSRRRSEPHPTLIRSLNSPETTVLTNEDFSVIWAGDDSVVFRRGDALYGQRVDWTTPALVGEAFLLTDELESPSPGSVRESVSAGGAIAYLQRSNRQQQFTWYDRSGRILRAVGEPGDYPTWDLSSDGSRIATSMRSNLAINIWAIDSERGSTTRVTTGNISDTDPRFSPNGSTLIFGSLRDPARSPYRARLTGDTPLRLWQFPGRIFALDDWSRDGRWLLYHDARVPELYARALDEGANLKGEPVLVARTLTGFIDQGQFSPDGRWVAYNANESGTFEVYVSPFPATGDRFTVSRGGGGQPSWREDGKELYFLGLDGTVKAVPLTVTGTKLSAGEPVDLFKPRLAFVSTQTEQFAPHPSDTRFLVLDVVGGERGLSIGMILNWPALLKPQAAR